MSRLYGVMPWHLGGDPYLTYLEVEAYLEDLEQVRSAERRRALSKQRW